MAYDGQRTRRRVSGTVSTKAHVSAFLVGVAVAVYAVVASGVAGGGAGMARFVLDASAPSFEDFLVHHVIHTNPLHLAANVLVLVFVSSKLETRWGGAVFAAFYVLVTAAVAVVSVGVGCMAGLSAPREEVLGVSYGLSGAAIASLVAVAALWRAEDGGRWLAARHALWAGVFGLAGLLALLDGGWLGGGVPPGSFLVPQISGAAFGIVAAWLGSVLECWTEGRRERRRRHRSERLRALRAEVDDLLDKIRDRGVESLTSRERTFLRRASRHFKNG